MKRLLFITFALIGINASAQWHNFKGDMSIGLVANEVDGAGMNFSWDFRTGERTSLGGEFGFLGYTGPLAEGYHSNCYVGDYYASCNTTYSDGRGYGQGGWFGGLRVGTPVHNDWLLIATGGVYWWRDWDGYIIGEENIGYYRISLKNIKGDLSYEFGAGNLEFGKGSDFGIMAGIGYSF